MLAVAELEDAMPSHVTVEAIRTEAGQVAPVEQC